MAHGVLGALLGEFDPHDSIEARVPVEISAEMRNLKDVGLGNVLSQLRAFDGDEAERHHFFTQLREQVVDVVRTLKTTPEYEAYEGMVVKPGDTPTRGYNTPDTYDGYVSFLDLKICNVAGIMGTIPMHATMKHTGVLTIFRDIVKAIDVVLSRFCVHHPVIME